MDEVQISGFSGIGSWELGDAGIRMLPPDDSEAGRSPEAHPQGIGNWQET